MAQTLAQLLAAGYLPGQNGITQYDPSKAYGFVQGQQGPGTDDVAQSTRVNQANLPYSSTEGPIPGIGAVSGSQPLYQDDGDGNPQLIGFRWPSDAPGSPPHFGQAGAPGPFRAAGGTDAQWQALSDEQRIGLVAQYTPSHSTGAFRDLLSAVTDPGFLMTVAPILGGALASGLSGGGAAAGAAGSGGGSILPDSYWNMIADSGAGPVTDVGAGAVDAAGGAAGNAPWALEGAGAGNTVLTPAEVSGATGSGGGLFNNIVNHVTDPTNLAQSAASQGLQHLGQSGGNAANTFNPDTFNFPNLDANGNVLQSAFPQSSRMQSLVDAGVPASLLQSLGGLGSPGNLGSLTSLIGGALGAGGSILAGNTQADAANRATDAQMAMFNTLNNQSAPYRQAGYNALGQLNSGTAPGGSLVRPFTAADLNTNLAPNYQFQLEQGLGATQNLINKGGGLIGGNALRGVNNYAQDYAGNAYQNAFNNYNTNQGNIFNRLSAIAGLGQTANQQSSTAGTAISGNAAQTMVGAGTANASGIVGATNALTGGLNNAASWYNLNNLMSRGGSA